MHTATQSCSSESRLANQHFPYQLIGEILFFCTTLNYLLKNNNYLRNIS